ncbi:exonuclease 3'-5' domain-containing protein 2 [Cephus cinctus]|uniref:Exonuclease 3'-5' domain-containing protein 2 n=1 Tax=Cephus cinctus TaxID=211228 RepID=A0AAJ7FVC8_CEPCN|nr:exonuclease 3'-5' domain-containing protein 2 [Cephus cinctus]
MFRARKSNMFFVCVTVGFVLLASKYRDNVLRGVRQLCHRFISKRVSQDGHTACKKVVEVNPHQIIVAESPEKCDYAVQCISRDLAYGILGFDCEWVNEGPVSLLQLATYNGVCALFRLSKIGYVPATLKELLANKQVLKVGVASFEDGQKLTRDYGCRVYGTLDLRTLAHRLGLPSPKSLSALCMHYLNLEMEKLLEVRCGDWNADILAKEQMLYAAFDAYAAVLIYHEILERAEKERSFLQTLIICFKSVWEKDGTEEFHGLPSGVVDARFKDHRIYSFNNKVNSIINRTNSIRKSSVPARNKPLYHNCCLQAPDGEMLCTCDRKKAEWYVSKGLGSVVSKDPFTVKLNFEPAGRALGDVGRYYTQVKENQCVVCGTSKTFIRKNVVPREYRKYFPLVMKAHQSHDVLLLCPSCHEISNYHDLQLRRKLAEMCDAPLSGPLSHSRDEYPNGWRKLRSAVRALQEEVRLPAQRRLELERYVMECGGQKDITPEILNNLEKKLRAGPPASLTPSPQPPLPHGVKVVQYFEQQEGGLVELERIWREHFLEAMKPRFLPNLWSVSHNQERLVIRQTQNRIDPQDAKTAGLQVANNKTDC